MKTLTTLITIIFISLLSSPSWSETVTMDELVERNGLYYKTFSDSVFTGVVKTYYENGLLMNHGKSNDLSTCEKIYTGPKKRDVVGKLVGMSVVPLPMNGSSTRSFSIVVLSMERSPNSKNL